MEDKKKAEDGRQKTEHQLGAEHTHRGQAANCASVEERLHYHILLARACHPKQAMLPTEDSKHFSQNRAFLKHAGTW